jgi:hypothetical protein
VEGDTAARRTRIPEKAITSAPSTPERTGRSNTPSETTHGYGAAPVDRNTLLWTLVAFFGASILFSTIRRATEDESAGVQLLAQLGAGLLVVAAIVVIVKRRQQ